ncbi:hypothetical protein ACRALDRAFT_1066339 [Sodiomyces alcalophilus JCM 7366]|uniref:uncharacterized protein n=1 Tax=Sodiomyces alcalophilus JCM 7366 TaxID=591952 RepID=UPI0039B3A972
MADQPHQPQPHEGQGQGQIQPQPQETPSADTPSQQEQQQKLEEEEERQQQEQQQQHQQQHHQSHENHQNQHQPTPLTKQEPDARPATPTTTDGPTSLSAHGDSTTPVSAAVAAAIATATYPSPIPQHQTLPPTETPAHQAHHLQDHPQDHHQDHHHQQSIHSTSQVHLYATNGLQVLQAATDAAQALQNVQQHFAVTSPHPPPQQQQFGPTPQQPGPMPVSHSTPNASPMAGLVYAPIIPAGGDTTRDQSANPKLTRLRRACDMCSQRKVKCDESGPPCKPCQDLQVDCTFNRALKRRGPPNKHAQAARAAQRPRLGPGPGPGGQTYSYSPGGGAGSTTTTTTTSPHNAAQTLVSIAEGPAPRHDAEAIAPMPVLELLDRTNPEFLSLLASMIGVLVASFPRSARQHLKSQHSTHLFPRAIVMIEKCREIALDTRGARWAAKQPKTLDDAATSYFLGLAAGYTLNVNLYRYFTAECLTLIRELGFHRPRNPGELPTFGGHDTNPTDPLPFHHIKDQIGKRIFWCLLLGVRSFSQLGVSHAELVIPPSTPSLPYPALPENVDDRWIMANEIQFSENNTVTILTGFRFAVEIYTTMNAIVSVELVYGMSTLPWPDQRAMLRDALIAAKDILDRLPPELQLNPNHDPSNAFAGGFDSFDSGGDFQYVPPAYPGHQPANDVRNVIKGNTQRRRQLQYEIQKANIFVSQLATRSYFVELYFNLRDMHLADANKTVPDESTEEGRAAKEAEEAEAERVFELMTAERELIVQNLLHVLGAISQRNLEPNGGSLINKIRQVASTLLNDAPERKGPLAIKSEGALGRLIDVLVKLEGTGHGNLGEQSMTQQDEEEELRLWASLRDYQQQFAAIGGYAGNL